MSEQQELEQLRERFILPVTKEQIIQRIRNCLERDIRITRHDKDNNNVEVFFGRNFSGRKKQYWKEYALSTFSLLNNALATESEEKE